MLPPRPDASPQPENARKTGRLNTTAWPAPAPHCSTECLASAFKASRQQQLTILRVAWNELFPKFEDYGIYGSVMDGLEVVGVD